MRTATVLTILLVARVAGQPVTEHVEELRDALTARVRTEEDVAHRSRQAGAWLERVRGRKGRGLPFLRTLASYYAATDDAERRRHLDDLAGWLRRHESRLPVKGFRPVVGSLMLMYGVRITDSGSFALARKELALILGTQDDRRSAFWLMGRRGRDHGTDRGRAFLQDTIIPAILADHELDDTDRVYLLRRLYEVTYTGPRPFRHVEGPAVRGGRARTADLEGNVALVMYWATW